MTIIQLSALTVDMKIYPRKEIDKDRVNEYAEQMQANREFPPIKFAHVRGRCLVVDGVHRYMARKKIGKASISADDLGAMTEEQAFAEAVRLNAQHGKRLSVTERLEAYKRLIAQGCALEKATDIVCLSRERIEKCSAKTVTNTRTGEHILQIPPRPGANRGAVLRRILDLKESLGPEIEGKETIEHLRGVRNLIKQRYDPDVVKEARALFDLIDKTIASLSKEPA